MTQYINKSALVAEIKRRRDFIFQRNPSLINSEYCIEEDNAILEFIDTLEAKEVDLDKEITNYISGNFFGSETMGFFSNRTRDEPNDQDIALCAKHFFELGMRASNPITAADRGIANEIIFALNALGEEKMISYDKEIEWVKNKVKEEE